MGKHIRFDWAIKRLLRQKANFVILEGFLSELLSDDIKIVEVLESEGNKQAENDKFNRVDILVKDSEETLMLVEVQAERQHDYFHRMCYGQAKLITDHIHEGDPYDKIKKVHSINIVYFDLGQGEDYIYRGETVFLGLHKGDRLLLGERQKALYNEQEPKDIFPTYHLIKVNNFDDVAKDSLDEWVYFLKNSEIPKNFKARGLSEAREKLRADNLEGMEKTAYQLWVKEQRIRMGEFNTAFGDGKKAGFDEMLPLIEEAEKQRKEAEKQRKEAEKQKEEERKQKEKAEAELLDTKSAFAKTLLGMGLSIEEAAQKTGLPVGVLEKLL